jgi:hypothetical protein
VLEVSEEMEKACFKKLVFYGTFPPESEVKAYYYVKHGIYPHQKATSSKSFEEEEPEQGQETTKRNEKF